MTRPTATVTDLATAVYRVPTDAPEADGTIEWSSTTMVLVRVRSGRHEGCGWTYAGPGAQTIVDDALSPVVTGGDALAVPGLHEQMVRTVRNLGRPGEAACAISAVDIALWDLKARLLDMPLCDLWGRARDTAPVYGSGGFTTYDDATTVAQLTSWLDAGIPRVKIKIGESWGRRPERDLHRVAVARRAIGDDADLYVDANGGYRRKQAIRIGRHLTEEHGVTWFEEPVSSDDHEGLRHVRAACDADVTAGEYGYSPAYFHHLLAAEAVDCVQVDVTRCGGYTDWLAIAHLVAAGGLEVSAHCAPNLHASAGVTIANLRHLEYFHDHVRIERMLFEGALDPEGGGLDPSRDRPGHGLTLRDPIADRYRIG